VKPFFLIILLLLTGCSSENHSSNKRNQNVLQTASLSNSEIIEITDKISSWTLGLQKCVTERDSLYPLIVYLHGGISTTRTDKGHDAFKMFQFVSDSIPLFIASPSGNRDAPWWSRVGTERILSTVHYMKVHYPIDTSKIFLAGVSDGATGLFTIAGLENHPFAGFIGSAGYPVVFQDHIQESIGRYSVTPFMMYVCGNDRLYQTDSVVQFYQTLQTSGVPLHYTLYPEAEHGFDFKELERDTIIKLIQSWTLEQ